ACTVSLPEPAVSVQTGSTTNEAWGKGQVLRLGFASGSGASLTLYDRPPFVLVQMSLHNAGSAVQVVDRHTVASVTLRSAAPVEALRAFGTFGLSAIEAGDNPGSYAHLAIVDPATRAGALCAWLTHDRGSGVFFTERRAAAVAVEARLDFGRLQIEPGQSAELETLLIGAFDDVRLGLEAYADAVAARYGIELPCQPAVYCTWYHAGASDEAGLARNTECAAEHLKPYGFSVVQIDDGWQLGQSANGPKKNFTGHNPEGPYPHGMAATAEHIRSHGLVPGLWLMPFAGTADDPFFADKQHFFATKDATPFEVHWGGTCFDMTHPDTLAYVRATVARICGQWGYRYIKIDGLWTGAATDICYINTEYKDDRLGETRLHDPAKTHIEAYRDGLAAVRDGAGDDTFILGCCIAQNLRTLGASFGLVDAMRVGPDNGVKWEAMTRGPFSGSNLYFLHGRVWYNDPDPVYVRPAVPVEQAQALVSWVTLTGQLNASSFDYADLPAERLDLLERSMPAHGLLPRPVDLFDRRIPRVWLLSDPKTQRHVIGLFNWEEKRSARIEESLERIGLPKAKAYIGFDYWGDRLVGPFRETLSMTLPPASCCILAVRPVRAHPQVIGTNRHITQGIIDLAGETWRDGVLSGTSAIVGGDTYELRVVVPDGWTVESVRARGIETSLTQDGPLARVTLRSQTSRSVRWKIGVRS
ncbi:alpha-galactosidase, partial [bacterium]|nr:alpha-galactosidase [bacterium]